MKGLVVFKSACVASIVFTIITIIQTDQQWQIQRYQERIHLQGGVSLEMLDESNKIINNRPESGKDSTNVSDYVNRFFRMKSERVNAHRHKFIVKSKDRCNDKPFLILLCLSKYSDIRTRSVIRNTWARVIRTGKWPLLNETIENVTMVFLLGLPDIDGVSIQEEIKIFKDIVVMDFQDSYDNLTTKVLMGFKWVNRFCSRVKYVLKVDQDTFVHIPNLISYLNNLTLTEKGLVAGRVNYKPKVYREGRWNLTWDEYPFVHYPPYLSGNTYVISGNALRRMTYVAEHLPYLKIEDVFITGTNRQLGRTTDLTQAYWKASLHSKFEPTAVRDCVIVGHSDHDYSVMMAPVNTLPNSLFLVMKTSIVRKVIGAKIHNRPGFTYFNETKPALCSFHNHVRISATNTDDEHKVELWKALHLNMTNCYVPPLRNKQRKSD